MSGYMARHATCPTCFRSVQVRSSGLFANHLSSGPNRPVRRTDAASCPFSGGISSLPDLRCPPTREADVPGLRSVARRDLIRERAKAVRS